MKKLIKILPFLFIALLIFLVACNKKDSGKGGETSTNEQNEALDFKLPKEEENPLATITLEDGREIIAVLIPQEAPNTVFNFISLANKGFYDGLTFHRASAGTLIQGGDPNGNGTGGPGYGIKGEFSSNGVDNSLKHVRGTLSMARSSMKDSAGSQFFIVSAFEFPSWDGEYAAFGRIIDGMDYVDDISNQSVKNSGSGELEKQVKIKSIRVETNGYNYPEPETLPSN